MYSTLKLFLLKVYYSTFNIFSKYYIYTICKYMILYMYRFLFGLKFHHVYLRTLAYIFSWLILTGNVKYNVAEFNRVAKAREARLSGACLQDQINFFKAGIRSFSVFAKWTFFCLLFILFYFSCGLDTNHMNKVPQDQWS